MTMQAQLKLVKTRKGRIILHTISYIKDHHFKSHAKGIVREICCIGKAVI